MNIELLTSLDEYSVQLGGGPLGLRRSRAVLLRGPDPRPLKGPGGTQRAKGQALRQARSVKLTGRGLKGPRRDYHRDGFIIEHWDIARFP